jgi:chemotaxis protein methyltransferase CheR
VTPQDYDYVRQLLKERSGLVLSADKQYLVESRLLPVVRKTGHGNLAELIGALRCAPKSPLATTVVEAMTTNESFFFRDKLPFEHFRDLIMPAMAKARDHTRHIRIWCSAAATGQEPYSLAMAIKEMGAMFAGWRIDILATDISNDALTKARHGLYSQFEIQRGLPIQMLLKYFTQVGDLWQIASELRSMVEYRQFNLLQDFSGLGTFDAVFCRNVLIYFDQPTKSAVLNRLARSVAPDGYLMLGAAETVVGLTDQFRPLTDHRGVYVPAPAKAVPNGNVVKLAAAVP